MKKIPPDAFDFYFSPGPPRSYQAVADKYGVTKRAVTNLAGREDWQRRLAAQKQESQVEARRGGEDHRHAWRASQEAGLSRPGRMGCPAEACLPGGA